MKTYEALEQRVVLAADVMSCLTSPIDVEDSGSGAADVAEVCTLSTPATTCQFPSELETTSIDAGCLTPSGSPTLSFDLQDGSDGMMLPLAGLESSSIEITATQDGQLTINCASDIDDTSSSPLTMELRDADGNVLASTADQTSSDRFATLQVNVCEGDQLTLNLINSCTDPLNAQVTASIADAPATETPAPSDMMNFLLQGDDQVAFSRGLQVENDVDQFQFTASADGRTTLKLLDMSNQDILDLKLTVTDSDNNIVAQGSTNELVELAFETHSGETYTVTVAEGSGKIADYQVNLQTAAHPVVADSPEAVADDECNAAAVEAESSDADIAVDEVADCDLPVSSPISQEDGVVACDQTDVEPPVDDSSEVAIAEDSLPCVATDVVDSNDQTDEAPLSDDTLVASEQPAPSVDTTVACPTPLDSNPLTLDGTFEGSVTLTTPVQPQINFVIDSSDIENVWVIGDTSQLPTILAATSPSTAGSGNSPASSLIAEDTLNGSDSSDASQSANQTVRHQRDSGNWGQRQRRAGLQSELQSVDQYFERLGNSQVLELV